MQNDREEELKRSSLLCLPRDYDFYSILIPVQGIIKKWRDKYLYAELVKRHPCFSDSCCYDSRLRISRQGIFADVVVMQKFRLAEYKNENHRKPIYIEERKGDVFFCEKMPLAVYLAAGLLVMVFVCGLMRRGMLAKTAGKTAASQAISATTEFVGDKPQFQTQSAAARFLLFAAQNGAQLYSFSWQTEGFTERFSAGIKNVYPQVLSNEFPDASFSVVSYKNEIPSFTVEIIQRVQNAKVNGSSISSDFIVNVRNMLRENGAVIQEESVSPYGLKILIPQDKNQGQIVKKLFSKICEQELIVQSVAVSHVGQGLCVSVYFADEGIDFSNQLCRTLMNNAELFVEKNETVRPAVVEKKTALQKPLDSHVAETPIGKLIKKDGTVIRFFKDEKGKITQRQEEE